MYGGPKDWFGSHGWHVEGVEDGENWEEYTSAYYRLLITNAEKNIPKIIYSKNRKVGDILFIMRRAMVFRTVETQSCFGKQKKHLLVSTM